MMRALIVYESMFGNTEAVARAVADGLGAEPGWDVEVVHVREAPLVLRDRTDLAVVGGPTHMFGLSRPRSRADAVARDPEAAIAAGGEVGLREWLHKLRRDGTADTACATFDTRIRMNPRMPGSAAAKAHRALRSIRCTMLAPAESFWVQDTTGPLADGELERAREWGRRLAALAAARRPPMRPEASHR